MIKSFKHKGLEVFFTTGNTKGIQTSQATKLRLQLAVPRQHHVDQLA